MKFVWRLPTLCLQLSLTNVCTTKQTMGFSHSSLNLVLELFSSCFAQEKAELNPTGRCNAGCQTRSTRYCTVLWSYCAFLGKTQESSGRLGTATYVWRDAHVLDGRWFFFTPSVSSCAYSSLFTYARMTKMVASMRFHLPGWKVACSFFPMDPIVSSAPASCGSMMLDISFESLWTKFEHKLLQQSMSIFVYGQLNPIYVKWLVLEFIKPVQFGILGLNMNHMNPELEVFQA